jgi:hypothetical protein
LDIREAIKKARTLKQVMESSAKDNTELLESDIIEISEVSNWLEKLSDSEREIFEERAGIVEFEGGMERERAEVEAIKLIIQERVIKGKCDKCERGEGCMLTRAQRPLCEGPFN